MVSVRVLSLSTGSLTTSRTSSGLTTGVALPLRTPANILIESVSRPGTKAAFCKGVPKSLTRWLADGAAEEDDSGVEHAAGHLARFERDN